MNDARSSTISVLGVPNGAGAYSAGLELAPDALRQAGLIDTLTRAGWEAHDAGDLTRFTWYPDRENPTAQHVVEVVRETREIADTGARLLAAGGRVLILGGSCTVAVGMCAALRGAGMEPHLVYLDRHLDLNTPRTTIDGAFGWMGMGHALALDGAAPELVSASGTRPLLTADTLSYLGVDTTETTDGERQALARLAIPLVSLDDLVNDPAAAAKRALSALPDGPFAVHVDVDVLDFIDAPLAENVEGRNTGPSLVQLEAAIAELWRHPDCRALSIGQLHPAHAAGDLDALPRFVDMLGRALRKPSVTQR